jgi:hypothetical protein
MAGTPITSREDRQVWAKKESFILIALFLGFPIAIVVLLEIGVIN